MNRIFRLIWNESLNAYVPAAETARGRGKRSTRRLVAAVLSLTAAGAAQANGDCNGGTGTITGVNSNAYAWIAPPTDCTIATGAKIETANTTALTVSGAAAHGTLTNNGFLHGVLNGSSLANVGVAALKNSVNVGGIINTYQMTGDYETDSGLNGTGNIFHIFGLDNTAAATIGSVSNSGTIRSTIGAAIGASQVSHASVVALDNAGSIGTLSNSGTIIASFGGGVVLTGNTFFIAGIANSGQIQTLTSSGQISSLNTGIYNSGTIGQLSNSGTIATTGAITFSSSGYSPIVTDDGSIYINGGYGTWADTSAGWVRVA